MLPSAQALSPSPSSFPAPVVRHPAVELIDAGSVGGQLVTLQTGGGRRQRPALTLVGLTLLDHDPLLAARIDVDEQAVQQGRDHKGEIE